jgi:hypothetical protein
MANEVSQVSTRMNDFIDFIDFIGDLRLTSNYINQVNNLKPPTRYARARHTENSQEGRLAR